MPIESLCATRFPDARCSERVLHLRVSESPVCLASTRCASACCLPAGWEGLIAMNGGCEVSRRVQTQPIAQAPLVKLQVFIDLGNALIEQPPSQAPWAALPVAYSAVQSEQAIERWYIEQAMAGGVAYPQRAWKH